MAAHRHRNILLSLILAFAALSLLLLGIASAAGITAQETALNPNGLAYELTLDSQGKLWVSDADAGEIWSFDTTSGAYTAYLVGGMPSDAHSDGAGSVWWADYDSNRLGRLSTSSNQATIWEIPGSSSLYSTVIDSSGDVWVSDSFEAFIYKLDPDANQLCTYALPDLGISEYLHISSDQLWFGDYVNARLVRLRDGTFDWWDLPADNYPRDLELDATGRLWWTDSYQGYLGRLDSDAATITTFTPPTSTIGTPEMLKLSCGKVWYSQLFPGQVVVLDPAVATGDAPPVHVNTGTHGASPTCSPLLPSAPTTVATTSGPASWTGQTYPTTLDAAGWKMYQMPDDSYPWGIAATDKVWLVDQGRQVLARLNSSTQCTQVYLPLVQRP